MKYILFTLPLPPLLSVPPQFLCAFIPFLSLIRRECVSTTYKHYKINMITYSKTIIS